MFNHGCCVGSMDPKDFLCEAAIMKKLRHPKLIQLYAVCTLEEPNYIIKALMQYASNIKTNAADVSRLIGECGDNMDECYTIIPIRTAIDKLKREGKGFWDYLKKNH